MRNQKGSAVALVLLLLGLLSILAAGLLVQSQYDTKITRAQRNYDRYLNLADGAATMALTRVSYEAAPEYSGGAVSLKAWDSMEDTQWNERLGRWVARMSMKGTAQAHAPGWEAGVEGFHELLWVAEGVAARLAVVEAGKKTTGRGLASNEVPPDRTVIIPVSRFDKNY